MSLPYRSSPARRHLANSTCLTTVVAGLAVLQPTMASAQLLTLGSLSSDLNALTGTVTSQGTQIVANTNALSTLNTNLNTVTSTVNSQATALQSVQNTVNTQVADLAAVTTRIGQQDTLISANVSALNGLNGTVGTLAGTVAGQGSALQTLQTNVTSGAADLAALTTNVGQQATQIATNTGALGTLTSSVGTLNGSLGTLSTTVANQAAALQTVGTAVNANVADVATLSTTVGQQGAQITANTGALGTLGTTVGTLSGSLNTLSTTVADQGVALQNVGAAVTANVADVATLTTNVGQQAAQITANTGALGTLGTTVGTLSTTVADQASTLQNVGNLLDVNVADLATLTTTVGQQGTQIDATIGSLGTLGNTVGTLSGSLGILTDTVAGQGTTLQNVGAALNANVATVADLATTVGQQGAQIVANTGALGTLGTSLGTLNGSVGTLATTVADQASALQNVGDLLNVNVDDLATLTATVGQQGTQITANVGAINTLNTTVGSLVTTVTDQGATLGTLGAAVNANVADLANLTVTVGRQGDQTDTNTGAIGTLNGTVGALTGTVGTLATTLADAGVQIVRNSADIGDLQGKVGVNVADIALLQATLGSTGTDVSQLQNQVANHEVRITANTTDLGALTATVTAQGGRIVQQGADLDTANANLASLQSIVGTQGGTLTALGTTVASQSTTIGTQGTQIQANTDAILSLRNMAVSGNASPVQFVLPEAPLVAQATATNDVAILGATAAPVRLHNIAEGTIAVGSTDAVNGGQLNDTNVAVSTLSGSLTSLTGVVTTQGSDIAGLQTRVVDLGTTATAQASLLDQQGVRITASVDALDVLRRDAETGAIGPLRYSTPTQPTVPNGGTVTNDVTLVGFDAAAVKLHNVGEGTLAAGSTDAVNGSQLNDTNVVVSTLSGSLTSLTGVVATQGSDIAGLQTRVVDLGTTATAQASLLDQQGVRITASVDALGVLRRDAETGAIGPLRYSTPTQPTVPNGGTVTNDVTLVGFDASAVKLHNVGEGTLAAGSTDAVNGSQLNDTNVAVNTLSGSLTSLTGVVTTQGSDIAGLQTRVVDLGTTATAQASLLDQQGVRITASVDALGVLRRDAETGAIGPLRYSTPAQPTVPNGGTVTNDVTLVGFDASAVKLHNVGEGTVAAGSTDAVNGGQLFALSRSYQGLADLAVQYDDASQSSLTFGRAGAPVLLRNVTAGTLAAGSTDAVNGGQLFDTNQNLATLSTRTTAIGDQADRTAGDLTRLADSIGNGSVGPVRYADAESPTVPSGTPSQDLTLVGTADAPVRLHNVADGLIGLGSTDAINGRQFYGLGSAVSAALGSGFTYDPLTGFAGSFSFDGESYANVQSVFGAIEGSILDLYGDDDGTGTGTGNGPRAQRKYFHTNSVQADSTAAGIDSTAIGPTSMAMGVGSVALGRDAMAGGDSSVAIGDGATAMDGKAVSIGLGNVASGDGAVAIGDPNFATGEGAVALGKDNIANGIGAMALGNINEAIGEGAAAIGSMNRTNGQGAAAVGFSNVATGVGAIAIGSNNQAIGNGSLAIGINVATLASDTLAIGNNANALGTSSIALGNRSTANNDKATALGDDAIANGFYSTALGASSRASDIGTTALGISSVASGFASTAVGSGAIADQAGSVALGAATQTFRGAVNSYSAFGVTGSQESLGEIAIARNLTYYEPVTNSMTPTGNRQITGLAAGSADTDAVNVAQLRGISGTLGAAFVQGFGSGASYDAATGSLTGPSYVLNGVAYANVGDALQALSARTVGAGGGTGGGTTSVAVTYDTPSGSDVTLAPGGTAIHNVAPGTIAAGSTDAVNGSQLAQTNAQLATTTARVDQTNAQVTQLATSVANGTTGPVRYADRGSNVPNGGTRTNDVALVGADTTAPVGLHNVAAGSVAAGSTDAVNGTQLAATDARVATIATRVTTVEEKADRALASSTRAIQYDAGGSVTLGNGSSTPVALHNVAAGTVSTDAVNVGQLATATSNAVSAAATYTDQRIGALSFDLARVDRNANAGTAGAMALAGMPQAFEEGKNMLMIGVATFQGQSAVAMGMSRVGNDGHTVLKLGATYNSRKQVGANAGIGYQF